MQKLLVKLFIKDYQNTNSQKVRSSYGTLSGAVGIISNIIICIIKLIIGLLSASVSIIADGINNLSDVGTSIVTLLGFKLSNKKPNKKHPFGYQRMEYLCGVAISIIILIVGGALLYDSLLKVINPEEVSVNWILIIILAISIFIKLWQSIFYMRMSKAINSISLKVNARDSLNDCISTLAVVVGSIIILLTGWTIVDGILGIIVAIFILYSGIGLLKETIDPLIGTKPSEEEINNITSKILRYPGVLGIHDMIIHSYGQTKKFVTIHIEVDRYVDIMISHDMVDNIEADFKKQLNIDLVIHMDPIETKDEKVLELKTFVLTIIHDFDPSITIHDFRVVLGVTHTNVLFDLVIPYDYKLSPNSLRELLVTKISSLKENLNIIINIDQEYDRNI